MIEKILVAVIAGSFCAMLTAIISLVMAPKLLKVMVEEAIRQHSAVWHQDSMYKYVETEMIKHTTTCQANLCIDEIKVAVFWLVEKNGGDIMKMFPKKRRTGD